MRFADGRGWITGAAFAAVAFALGLAGAGIARATTSDIQVVGVFDFAVSGDTAFLTVDRVNTTTNPPQITGELYLELWAFRVPYSGLGQAGYQQNGYRLASYAMGRIAPQHYLLGVYSGPIAYQAPPPGTYYLTSMIVEYDAGATNEGGMLPRAFFNYPAPRSPITVAPPAAAATPQAGIWWDPAQNGTGYAITVRNGVAAVAAFSYETDGSPVWYFTSAALTDDGRTFSATLDKYAGGPCIGCTFKRAPVAVGNDGNITIIFHSPTSATAYLPGGRIANIVPMAF
jgi:hypothetical protein